MRQEVTDLFSDDVEIKVEPGPGRFKFGCMLVDLPHDSDYFLDIDDVEDDPLALVLVTPRA